jgi:hypothetical protein
LFPDEKDWGICYKLGTRLDFIQIDFKGRQERLGGGKEVMGHEEKGKRSALPGRKLPEKKNLARFEPEIIVDLLLEGGIFYLAVKNISSRPLYLVSVRFEPPLYGLQGKQNMAEQPLFQKVFFLAPQKEIRTLLDSSRSYFARSEPEQIEVHIHYRDFLGKDYQTVIHHDLEIYKALWEIGDKL